MLISLICTNRRWIVFLGLASLGLFGCGSGSGGVDAEGNPTAVTFSKSFGGPGFDSALHAIETSDGGYAFVGYRTEPGDITETWFTKLDGAGDLDWQTSLRDPSGLPRSLYLTAFAPAEDGGYCLAGQRRGTGGDLRDMYVARIDATGNVLWEATLDGGAFPAYQIIPGSGQPVAASLDTARAVVADVGTACYVSGFSYAALREIDVAFPEDALVSFTDVNGSPADRQYFGARRLITARADEGQVQWSRASYESAFVHGETSVAMMLDENMGVTVARTLPYAGSKGNQSGAYEILQYGPAGRVQLSRAFTLADVGRSASLLDDSVFGDGQIYDYYRRAAAGPIAVGSAGQMLLIGLPDALLRDYLRNEDGARLHADDMPPVVVALDRNVEPLWTQRIESVDNHLVDCTTLCEIPIPHGGQPLRLDVFDQYGNGIVGDGNTCTSFDPNATRPRCVIDIDQGNRSIFFEWQAR